MLPERPQFGLVPCPACGTDVDPIRAARVVWLEDGPRFLCGERCRERFALGERSFDARASAPTPTPTAPRPSIPELVREATQVRDLLIAETLDGAGVRRRDSLVALGLGALALALIGLSDSREVGWLGAFVVLLCAGANAQTSLGAIRAAPPLRWLAPVGLALATLGVLLGAAPEDQRWALLACALSAILLSLRAPIQAWAHRSLERTGRDLESALPTWARVPSVGGTSYEEVPASALEPGDVTVVLEGERLPADGVIEGGDGIALLYPRAPRPARAAVGDFLLAGTQVTEGALTVRAQRTGRNRTLAHMLRLKVERAPGSSGLARARWLLAQWGWVPFVAAAVVCAATAGVANAGVLLLGLPALALVASIDTPLDSAALSAARRGMFFGDEAALLDAGRVQTTAILLRGALTAGEPVVQQVQTLGSTDVEYAVGLAAAAERITPEHPIARAILRYAEEHGIAEAALRKERHHAGLGITAISRGGRSVAVGRRQLLLNEGVSVAAADEEAKHIENEGLTPIFVAVDGSLEALLAVLDPTHVGAPDAVRRLAELPSEVVILSGDDRRTVERIAQQLGASRVKAPLLPKERALEVRALKETGGVTAAIGRGGEDDAVLAAADVPVSIRLVGTATEQRGVVAAGRDVRDAADALWIAHAARRSVGRALLATLVLGAVVSAGAWLGWLTPPLAIALAIGIEVWTLRAGSRLLRRVDLRVPMQQ